MSHETGTPAPAAADGVMHFSIPEGSDPLSEFEPEGSVFAPHLSNEPPAASRPGAAPRRSWMLLVMAGAAVVQAPFAALWFMSAQNPISSPAVARVEAAPVATSPQTLVSFSSGAEKILFTGVHLTGAEGQGDAQPLMPAAPVPTGWLAVTVPMPLLVHEAGRVIGTTDAPLVLPEGVHQLEFVGEELGFRVKREVTVAAGATTSVEIERPSAPISINAQPWADVWINGESVGATPIGTLSRPIGPYELVFRHPTLGERRAQVLVSLKAPVRVSVDFRSAQ